MCELIEVQTMYLDLLFGELVASKQLLDMVRAGVLKKGHCFWNEVVAAVLIASTRPDASPNSRPFLPTHDKNSDRYAKTDAELFQVRMGLQGD